MSPFRRFIVASLIALAVWTAFAWPLPRYLFSGIPSSDRNVEKYHFRKMIAGDHLQLLYHFQLASDMVSGKIPLFCNLYEFNTGDDAARYKPDPYYVPFSLIYTLGSWVAGQAFGWNLAGFLSILLTFFLTWELVRRYVDSEYVAATAALIAFMFPYRWITLLSGSPTGFAMVFPPALLLGLDLAMREQRVSGGLLAGSAVFLGYCSDLHVFFFSVLAIPFWCVVAIVWWPDCCSLKRGAVLRLARSILPLVALTLAAVAVSTWLQRFAGTDVAHGRDWEDVRRFSPVWQGLFSWRNLGVSNHVFFGGVMTALLLGGLVPRALALWGLHPARATGGRSDMWAHPRRSAALIILCLAIAGIVVLALGVNGPFAGGAMRVCRETVPRYAMIRQPVKIYCVLPTILAVALGLTLAGWNAYLPARLARVSLAAAVAAAGLEYRFQISPTICLLEREQAAYRTVAEEAARGDRVPRILALPLWPGDSHYTSLNQYYAALYGIRMINGYSPVIDESYFRNVFQRYESANLGVLSEEQLESLRATGIEFIIFHEDQFPEKVSPFPAGFTLKRLLNHPRLTLLNRDGAAWVFRILGEPASRAQAGAEWFFFAPARLREGERFVVPDGDTVVHEDPEASGGFFARLGRRPVNVASGLIPPAPGLRWMLRARGNGRLRQAIWREEQQLSTASRSVTNRCWDWLDVPLTLPEDGGAVALRLAAESGRVDLDTVLLTAGGWPEPKDDEAVCLPAPGFFHAGYTDLASDSVVLRKDFEPDRAVFYGPNMPLRPGKYRLCLAFSSDGPAGTVLGFVRLPAAVRGRGQFDVVSGEPCIADFEVADNLPVRIDFVFARNADIRIHQVILRRVGG